MRSREQSGFTLFELLISISIITIIVAGGFMTIAQSNKSRALERAADTLHSMVRIARTQAITHGAHARLIINNDSNDKEAYLRQIGVVVEDTSAQGQWIAVERGAYLPEGVYVVPQGGDSVAIPTGLPRSIYRKVNNSSSDDTAVYTFDYPLKVEVDEADAGKPKWICIQFAANGRLSSVNWGGGGLVPLSNQLIVARGSLSGEKVRYLDSKNFVGIAFKLSGSSYQMQETGMFELEKDVDESSDGG